MAGPSAAGGPSVVFAVAFAVTGTTALSIGVGLVVLAVALIDDHGPQSGGVVPAAVVANAVVIHGDLAIPVLLPPPVGVALGDVGALHHDDFTHRPTSLYTRRWRH